MAECSGTDQAGYNDVSDMDEVRIVSGERE